jgi:transposase
MSNKKYTKQFKLDAVQLVMSSDKSTAAIAQELGINPNSLYNWVSTYRSELLSSNIELTPEQELKQLRKEVAELRQEKEILKKAAVDSICQCNTLFHDLLRRSKFQHFSGSFI